MGPFLAYIQNLPYNVSLPNGESKSTFFKRSIEALNEILTLYKEPLIVAHGGTFWAILHMLKLPTELIKNAGCIYFDVKEDTLKIQMLEGK